MHPCLHFVIPGSSTDYMIPTWIMSLSLLMQMLIASRNTLKRCCITVWASNSTVEPTQKISHHRVHFPDSEMSFHSWAVKVPHMFRIYMLDIDISTLIRYMFTSIFLHSVVCVFTILLMCELINTWWLSS